MKDLFGFVLQKYEAGDRTPYGIRREDGLWEFPHSAKDYFYPNLFPNETKAFRYVKGNVLDVGIGAGRHALLFQKRGHKVVGIDTDKRCVLVSKKRGVRTVFKEDIFHPKKVKRMKFDTIWLGGNNLGIAGVPTKVPRLFRILDELTNAGAIVLATGFDFQKTRDPIHLKYHRLQKKRGNFPGSTRLRIEYKDLVSEWFWWLHTPSKLLEESLRGTPWKVGKYFRQKSGRYMAVIRKGSTPRVVPPI